MRDGADQPGYTPPGESRAGAVSVGSPVALRISPPRTKLLVQTWDAAGLTDAALRSALQAATGVSWPVAAGTTAGTGTRVLCYGPVAWLVVAPEATSVLLLRLEDAVRGFACSVTDHSQGLAALEVTGTGARELLSKGCCLDLHPRAFPAGACARTRLAQVPVIVDAPTDGSRLVCYVARSHLDYLHHWLTDAAVELQGTSA